ncbi:MAG: replicative DNA helicase [Ignavibacteriota bacterium]
MIKRKSNEKKKLNRVNEDTAQEYGGKMPPNALELEVQVLGAILLDNMVFSDIVVILRPEFFYRTAHSTILEAMIRIDNRNEAMDGMTVIEELKRMGKLEAVGGVEYILNITESTSSSANAKQYARIIYEKFVLRDLIHISSEILGGCFNPAAEPYKILADASKDILDTSESFSKKRVVSVEEEIKNVVEQLGSRRDSDKKNLPGVPTGYFWLDDLTLGFQKSELIIMAGRPSHGKTALTLNIARNAALKGYKIAFFSLEMTKMEIITRLISIEARVDGQKLKSGRTSNEEWARVVNCLDKLKVKLFIDDTSEMNVLELRAKARRLKYEEDIDMVVVDYLQLLKGEGSYERRDLEVAHVSRSLKALAKELNIPVVAAAQLNRGIEQKKEKKPQLSDLRESGAIEQDADVVIFIHREFLVSRPNKEDPKYDEIRRRSEITIGKQRNGPPGSFDLVFLEEFTRFEDKSKEPQLDVPSEYQSDGTPF